MFVPNPKQNIFQNFTRKYSLSKTLKFELKPLSVTKKYPEEFIISDTQRDKDYQNLKNIKEVVFMKLFIVFFILFSGYYGNSQSVDQSSSVESEDASSREEDSFTNEESKKDLTRLQIQLKKYVDSLLLILLDEKASEEDQIKILDEIKSVAEINGEITRALNQISQKREECLQKKDKKCISNDLWIQTHSELIRRKQLNLIASNKNEKALDENFYVDLALDGVGILTGSLLFFIPAVGPAISIPLTLGRISHITLTGQKLGAILMTTGVLGSGVNTWDYIFGEDEPKVLSFISDITFRSILAKEFFNILSLSDQKDKHLAANLFHSPDSETLINELLNAIQEEQYSIKARLSSFKALKVFAATDMDEDLKKKIIVSLKQMIDTSTVPDLRESSVRVLGEIGERKSEVLEYLQTWANEDESDKFRLIALIQSGRNKTTFPIAIELLVYWIGKRNYKKNPLEIVDSKLEIPDFFRDAFLLAKKEELQKKQQLENYVSGLKEFIRLRILDVELSLRFSETLIELNGIEDSKIVLDKIYSIENLVTDLGFYVEILSDEMLFEDNFPAFEFLKTELSKFKDRGSTGDLESIEKYIIRFKDNYPDQDEITKKIETFLNSYKKILETIQKNNV